MAYTGYTIEEIEDALVSTLENDATLAAYVQTFDRLPMDRVGDLKNMVDGYPALIVAYTGGTENLDSLDVCDHAGDFVVLCANKDPWSASRAARGRGTGKGVYDMLHDVLSALHFSNLGLSIIRCVSTGVEEVAASAELTVFSRTFEVTWRLAQSA